MHATFDRPERDVTVNTDRRLLPSAMRRGPAIYMHTDSGWECVCVDEANNEWEWLPLLQRIEAVDGVGGVLYNKETGRWNFAGAIQGHSSLKTRSLPILPSDPRLGPFRDYDRNWFPCENGGKKYIDPGERYDRLPNGTVLANPDTKTWYEFLRHLKMAGLVEPMAEVTFRAERRRVEERRKLHARAERDRSASIADEELKRMDAAWAKEAARSAGQAEPVESAKDNESALDGIAAPAPTTTRTGGVKQPRRES